MLREVAGHPQQHQMDQTQPFYQEEAAAQDSTIPTTSSLNDDIFGSDDDDDDDEHTPAPTRSSPLPTTNSRTATTTPPPTTASTTKESVDTKKLRQIHTTAGYRDGISTSKSLHIQTGFDEGFSLGAVIGSKAGFLLGVLEGVVRAVVSSSPPVKVVQVKSVAGTVNASLADLNLRGKGKEEQDGKGVQVEEGAEKKEELFNLFKSAKQDLALTRLFGKEYFGPDGIWLFHVGKNKDKISPSITEEAKTNDTDTTDDAEEEILFTHVCAAHPMIQKWEAQINKLKKKHGLVLTAKQRQEEEEEDE
jgi:hypothetical protein